MNLSNFRLSHFSMVGAAVLFLVALESAPSLAQTSGAQATNFTIRDINGQHLRLGDFNKKVVVLDFWATWCKPCIVELRHLEKLYQKYQSQGLVVIGVSMDGPETQANVKPAVQKYGLNFPIAIDRESTVVKLYNPKHAAPFSVFIKDGKIIGTREGFQVSDLPAIEKEIQQLLKK